MSAPIYQAAAIGVANVFTSCWWSTIETDVDTFLKLSMVAFYVCLDSHNLLESAQWSWSTRTPKNARIGVFRFCRFHYGIAALAVCNLPSRKDLLMKSLQPCRACQGDQFRVLVNDVPPFTSAEGPASYTIQQCQECGMGRTEPILNNEQLAAHYDNFIPHRDNDVAAKAAQRMQLASQRGVSSFVLRQLYRFRGAPFAHFFGRTGDLLDIGCGNGHFCVRMQQLGWTPHAHDIYESACVLARRHQIPYTICDVPELPDRLSKRFDVVTSWHVLEHMLDPKSFGAAAYSLLKPGGEVVVEVPHLNAMERELFKKDWWLWMAPIHVNHFTKEAICRLLEDAGFEDIRYRTFGSHFAHSLTSTPSWVKKPLHVGLATVQSLLNRGSVLRVWARKPQN